MNSKEEIKLKSGIKTLAMWLIILLIFIVVVTSIVNNKDNELAYSELVSRIETGKTNINLKRLNEMCALLGTSESYVLNGVSDNSSEYLNNELSSVLKDCSAKD